MKKLILLALTIVFVSGFVPVASAQYNVWFVTATATSPCSSQQYFPAQVSVYFSCTVTGFPNFYFLSPALANDALVGYCQNSGVLATGNWQWGTSREGYGYITAGTRGKTDYGTVSGYQRCVTLYGTGIPDPYYRCYGFDGNILC